MKTFMFWLLLMGIAHAEEVSEETKKRALMLGYVTNGNSMVRAPHLGSIDVRELLEITKPPRVIPMAKGEGK